MHHLTTGVTALAVLMPFAKPKYAHPDDYSKYGAGNYNDCKVFKFVMAPLRPDC